MPLHDWTDRPGWDGVHLLWIAQLLHHVKPQLPEGYRAYVGTLPTVAVGSASDRPDLGVRQWSGGANGGQTSSEQITESAANRVGEPDEEVAVVTLDPTKALFIQKGGFLVAALELISPRNKDRPSARETYSSRYAGFLLQGVNLLLVDVHRRPSSFSFADRIAEELQMSQPSCPPPMAVSYRVGEPAATGGSMLAIWRRKLVVGQPLPVLPLPLTVHEAVDVDLEQTYQRAAADAYLE
jgi:Protein of unknown function (DUF4058)